MREGYDQLFLGTVKVRPNIGLLVQAMEGKTKYASGTSPAYLSSKVRRTNNSGGS